MADSPNPTPARGNGLAIVLLLTTGVQTLATLSVLALATVAPAAAAGYGLPPHLVGYQVSLCYVSAALVSLVAGSLVLRFGAVAVSQGAMALCAIGTISLSCGDLVLLFFGSLLIGAGYGLTNPAASHLLHRMAPAHHRNLLFSLKQTAVPIGGVVAGLLLPPLTAAAGWQVALTSCGGLSLLLFVTLGAYRLHLDTERHPATALLQNIRAGMSLLFERRSLRYLSLMAFCFSATQLSLMSFAVSMLVGDMNLTLLIAGGIASLLQGCGALGRIFWGILADRFSSGKPILISAGLISTATSLIMIGAGPDRPLTMVIILLCVFGASSIGWNGVFLAEVARISGHRDVGSMTGMVLFFTFSGVVIGPTCFASVYQLIGSYAATFGVMAVFPAIGTLAVLRINNRC